MTTGPNPSRFDELPEAVVAPLKAIEEELAQMMRTIAVPGSLREAMAYATLDGGKRLRPLLVWHGCVAAGGEGPESLPACTAVELVHCFSLVHDDLPALDDDDLRRGRPTLHKKAGEAMAILAGDALLARAFGVLAGRLEVEVFREVAGELAAACERMIAGQVLDTLGFGDEASGLSDEHRLEAIHRGKTGAMLVASLRMGGMCAKTDKRDTHPTDENGVEGVLERLTAYGEAIGLMFQVVDDLLDVTQTAEHLGKRSSKDAQAGKLTYPGVLGVERSRTLVEELRATALDELSDLGPEAEPLRLLAEYFAVRTK
ncbi:(2E,6E)-farnesyl diphosphate synthase [hydrothermal vent metagenome]|uniref:(2E,6E)-farnesyl diphosphate synthase n=1 Tax=hydrothermal vent metagenome TaxID=652676 RepID=A0A3B1DA68_9ZZZZ